MGGVLEGKTTLERERFRDNPAAIAEHLAPAFETNDLDVVLTAINSVMRAQNVQALSRETGLHRVTLYKSFGGKVNPPLGRVLKLLDGLNLRLTVQPLPLGKRPRRLNRGRPRKRTPKTS
jgi:probable addiction module antidote protein